MLYLGTPWYLHGGRAVGRGGRARGACCPQDAGAKGHSLCQRPRGLGGMGPRTIPSVVCVCVCARTVTVISADCVRDRLWVWDGSGASESEGGARGWVGGSVGEDGIPFVRVLRVQTMRHKMAGTCLMDIVCRLCRSMLL